MKYTKTVDLWRPEIHQAVIQGNLRLQTGQWIYAGDDQHKSRFVGLSTGKVIIAAHWQGNGSATLNRFKTLINIHKG